MYLYRPNKLFDWQNFIDYIKKKGFFVLTIFMTVNLVGDRLRLFLRNQPATPEGHSDSDEGFEAVPRSVDDLSQDFVLVAHHVNSSAVDTVNIPSNIILQPKRYLEIQSINHLPKDLGLAHFILEAPLSVHILAEAKKFISGINRSRYGDCYFNFGLQKQVPKKPVGAYYPELELSPSYFVEIASLDQFKHFILQKYNEDYRNAYNQTYKEYSSGSYFYYLPSYFTTPTHPGAQEGLDDAKNNRPNKYFR